MDIKKNDDIKLNIESVTSEGSAVGHYNGIAVFVRGAVPGVVGCGAACGGRWPGVAHPHVGRVLWLAQPHAGGAVPRHGHLRGRSGEVAVHGHVGAVSRVLLHRVAHRVPGVRAFEHDASAGA